MKNLTSVLQMPVSATTLESSVCIMNSLKRGTFQEHSLTDMARPFIEKQPMYLAAYERSLCSRNYRYVLECMDEQE